MTTLTMIRPDLEGDLIRFADGAAEHFGKRLPTNVAWHVFDPHDLENVSESVVSAVTEPAGDNAYHLHYQNGVEPFDLDTLRELLHLNGPLAAWRVARLAQDLAAHLQRLHLEDIPQLLVHPERIGRWAGKFVLLPTLACVLPPLSQLKPNEIAGWLHYIAPEILRTRGTDRGLLTQGDVYSLGLMLQSLCSPFWDPLDHVDPLALAEQRVEWAEAEKPGRAPDGFEGLQGLFGRMYALLPAVRPSLAQVLAELETLLAKLAPGRLFRDALARRNAPAAEQCLRDLESAFRAGVFGCSQRALRLMSADLALAETPPDCSRALTFLQAAESQEYYEADVQQRIGRAYALWTSQPLHLERSTEAYRRAAGLAGWPAEIIDEWTEVLKRFSDHQAALDASEIPVTARTRSLVILRTQCWARLEEYLSAWHEIALFLPRVRFDAELVELARSVARLNDPDSLVMWMAQFRDKPGFAAPVSIVWEVNGNMEFAEKALLEARAYTP